MGECSVTGAVTVVGYTVSSCWSVLYLVERGPRDNRVGPEPCTRLDPQIKRLPGVLWYYFDRNKWFLEH